MGEKAGFDQIRYLILVNIIFFLLLAVNLLQNSLGKRIVFNLLCPYEDLLLLGELAAAAGKTCHLHLPLRGVVIERIISCLLQRNPPKHLPIPTTLTLERTLILQKLHVLINALNTRRQYLRLQRHRLVFIVAVRALVNFIGTGFLRFKFHSLPVI